MGSYTFSPATQQVMLWGFASLDLEQVLLITNVTSNVIIYDFSDPLKGGALAGNVLTLDYNTSAMGSGDSLMIFVSIPTVVNDDCCTRRDGAMALGEKAPISQNEREQSNYDQVYEQLTYDTNMERILGKEILVNQARLKVEGITAPDFILSGAMWEANREVICNLSGHSTGTVQLSGTWAGTVTFYGTLDYTSWQTLTGSNINASTTAAATTTTNGLFVFPVGGLRAFKASFTSYTSGNCIATLSASYSFPRSNVQTTYDTNMAQGLYHEGSIKDALTLPQTWNNNWSYNVGDEVFYNGWYYVCISQHSSATEGNTPTNTTYWQRDVRQNKSLVTSDYVSPPTAPRLRVEIDMDGYQYRLMEQQALQQGLQMQADMLYQDYTLACMQDGPNGKSMAMGQDAMSHYNYQEIR